MTTVLKLGDLRRHGYSNNQGTTVVLVNWNQHWLLEGNGKWTAISYLKVQPDLVAHNTLSPALILAEKNPQVWDCGVICTCEKSENIFTVLQFTL